MSANGPGDSAPAAEAKVLEPTVFELSRHGRRGFRLPEEKGADARDPGIPERPRTSRTTESSRCSATTRASPR